MYSSVFGSLVVIKLLVPIWAMLYAFQPNVCAAEQEVAYPAYSEDGVRLILF